MGSHAHSSDTGSDVCPVAVLMGYLSVRGTQHGPLFLDGSSPGCVLLKQCGVRFFPRESTISNTVHGHSFCIGAATMAAARGVEDSVIKTLGR